MTAFNCPTADTLLDDYSKATTEYFKAADKLSNLVGLHDEFVDAKLRTEEASANCIVTRLALEKHRLEHNCGQHPQK
jgi:hypothetical protein